MSVRHVLLPPVGGRLSTRMAPLRLLIQNAYGVQPFLISGGPEWMNSTGYDIDAKAEGNPTRAQVWLMLQSLLEDRFKLRVHHETKAMPVYDMAAARSGLKLPKPVGSCAPGANPPPQKNQIPPGPCGNATVSFESGLGLSVVGREIATSDLIQVLSGIFQRPIVDKTGYRAKFDAVVPFAYQEDVTVGLGNPWAQSGGAHATDASGSLPILNALQQTLGLKLEPSKGPVETLVVDHAERPTEN